MYWIGQLISVTGSQMQLWALYWHLRTLSDQPMVISGIGLVRFLPVVALSLIAGVAADRFDRRKIMMTADLSGVATVEASQARLATLNNHDYVEYQLRRYAVELGQGRADGQYQEKRYQQNQCQ